MIRHNPGNRKGIGYMVVGVKLFSDAEYTANNEKSRKMGAGATIPINTIVAGLLVLYYQ